MADAVELLLSLTALACLTAISRRPGSCVTPGQPSAPPNPYRTQPARARDHYIRLDGNDYSVHPSAIGRRIEITAGLRRVTVTCEGRVVASHRRAWCWHQAFTDPAHLAAAELRRARVAVVRPPREAEVQVRLLTDYDAALGLGDTTAAS